MSVRPEHITWKTISLKAGAAMAVDPYQNSIHAQREDGISSTKHADFIIEYSSMVTTKNTHSDAVMDVNRRRQSNMCTTIVYHDGLLY